MDEQKKDRRYLMIEFGDDDMTLEIVGLNSFQMFGIVGTLDLQAKKMAMIEDQARQGKRKGLVLPS